MDNLKFTLTVVTCAVLIGLGGYWAFTSMQSSSEYVNNKKIEKLESENEDLKSQVEKLNTQLSTSQTKVEQKVTETPAPQVEKPATTVKKPTTTTYKNQTLINELQKLADKGVVLESGSTGPSVGTVQKFLNVYNKTSNKIDNDYGATTKTKVIAFQKAQGLTADGGVGKSTFLKMIAWLKKQG